MIPTTLPIDIKKPSQTGKPICFSRSPSPKIKNNTVTLHGGPFKNTRTVEELLMACVPELTKEQVASVVESAHTNNHAHVISCSKVRAEVYCRNLVENGLYASVD